MPLNKEQLAAVEYLDGPLLVLAGPGTGKTQLLSEKVAYILQNTDTNPDNILCLTFTDSGANNMRERLLSIVGKAAAKVNIHTYHAFGTRILEQYKNYSLDCPNFSEAIDDVTKYKIIKTIQQNMNGNDILRGDQISDIISTISSAKAYQLTSEDLTKIAEQNIADSEVLSNSISPILKNIVKGKLEPNLSTVYQPIHTILQNYQDSAPILKNIERNIVGLARDLAEALDEAKSKNSVKPLSDWKDTYFECDANNNYRLKDRIANKKLLSLAKVMEQYGSYLSSKGWYDFDDMINEAIRALQTDQGFRLTLSEKYQYILLDEYQDTNPSQLEIVKQLTDYEKPIVMAVGDDDQAIFSFQGASATNLAEFQKHYDAKVIKLTENYRSTQEILDLSAKVIADAPNRYEAKNLHANKPTPIESQISRHEFISSDAEYFWVAEQISELIKSGVPQTDIAIIAPKHKYILDLLPFLKSHSNINIAYEKRENILEDQKIHQILTISQYVYDLATEKTPTVSLLEVLSCEFWGLSMGSVLKTFDQARANKKSAFNYLLEAEDGDIRQVAEFLAGLVAKAFSEPLPNFINFLIGKSELNGFTSKFTETYLKNPYENFAFYENLNTLTSVVGAHLGAQNSMLKDLIETISDYEAAEAPILCASPYRESANAVQVLSAHKAKGLEFPHVFIINLDNSAWGKAKGNNNLLSLPKNLVQIRHTGNTDGERLRLLYVAITRSKGHLVMTNSLNDFRNKSHERLAYLGEYEDSEKNIISPYLPNQQVTCHYQEENITKLTDLSLSWTKTIVNSPDMKALYAERLSNYHLSASDLTSFIDIVYAGPTEFFRRHILKDDLYEANESTEYGKLIHAAFEKVTKEKCNTDAAIDFFLQSVEECSLDDTAKKHFRERGPDELKISLAAFGDILQKPNSFAEVNMNAEHIVYDGVPLVGFIDHIEVDDESKTIKIYDFKTGKYHAKGWDSDPTIFKYQLQLEFYKLLLNFSQKYAKYQITEGHILFVTPDKDGQVYDKSYQFSEEVGDMLKNLIKSVYQAIKSLEFLDDPEIYLDKDANKTVKDIKAFIELILAKFHLII